MIIAAAIRLGDVIAIVERPGRHHNIIHNLCDAGYPPPVVGQQGFINDKGKFLHRNEAMLEAKANNQVLHYTGGSDTLYSEDMW